MSITKNLSLLFSAGLISFLVFIISGPALGDEEDKAYAKAIKYFNEGNSYSKGGEYHKAIRSFRKAIETNNKLPAPHYNLANILVVTGQYVEAVKEYQAAIQINPMVPDYHRNLGYVYALMKKGDLSKQKYEELQKIDPKQAEALLKWIQQGSVGNTTSGIATQNVPKSK